MFEDGNLGNNDVSLVKYQSFIFRFIAKHFPRLLVWIFEFAHLKDSAPARALHKVLAKSKRIDVFPSNHGSRGFTILIDQQTSLYFHQDGDKFVYAGWEAGQYEERGNVTIFDNFKDE